MLCFKHLKTEREFDMTITANTFAYRFYGFTYFYGKAYFGLAESEQV